MGTEHQAPNAGDAAGLTALWHNLLLGKRLYISAWLRFLVVLGILAGSFFATYVVGVAGLPIARLAGCAAFLAVYNAIVFWLVRPYRRPEQAALGYPLLSAISHATITLDFLVLTYAIWLVGGAESPFLAFYLLHVIMAAVLLTRRAAYAHATLGYLLLAGLVLGEGLGWLPKNRPAGAVPAGADIEYRYVITVLVVYGLLMALAVFLMAGIAEMLREGERRLRQANQELERLSSMRRAFLHIALHDLKSPVGAVSMLVDNMASGMGGPLSEKQAHWAERAKVRLSEVLAFLRDMQVLAELDAAQVAAAAEPVDVAALLRQLVDEHQDMAQQRRHALRLELPAPQAGGLTARSVERLLREAVANYITNAIKYTPEGGSITVRADVVQAAGLYAAGMPAPHVVRVAVVDNGKGIAPEDQARLFGEFVRIAPKERDGPPVSGTGLGLSIVRRIAELHGGRAGVVSQVGHGSTFYIEIPAVR